ncbi:MAG: hypothetical protein MR750_09230 [Methanobrevibacter boviskoreani]|uniref:hypothetical protein n=1 Tax=Methanobrevibacter boviskoreani TaxID=1348249 RepID=UPI0023A85C1B|nr:hypothetical protein [Methanobrevibacter boviskoreani]MCI6931417.1 hypothetical protein [Methanobrevibacter boviskoreani]
MRKKVLFIACLIFISSFNLSIISCSSNTNNEDSTNKDDDSTNNDEDNNNNNDNDNEDTSPKEETILAEFKKDTCPNLVNSPKTTDGIYLINDDVTDIINDITLKYSTNVGLTGNSNYPNCIQVKKQTNNNFIISTYKKITKIIITSLKDTSYDTTYATLELNVNSSMNEEINTTSGISEIKNTYLLNEEASTITLSNTSSRAMYLQKLEIIGYNE